MFTKEQYEYLKEYHFSSEELNRLKLELYSQNDERIFYKIMLDDNELMFSGMIVVEKNTGEVYNPYLTRDQKHFKLGSKLQEEMFSAKYEEEKAKELLDYGRW